MKKSVSFLLVLVLAFSCMLSVQVYGYEVAESKLAFNADFSSTSASPGSFLGGTLATIDSTYGTSYKLSGSSTAYFYANFDASRYEATSLSFDVYAESETARGVLEIFDPVAPGNTYIADANVHRTLYIKQDGLVSTFNKFNVGGEGRYYPVKYAAGEWTHYDIWIDYVLGSVLCYKNEELLGELSKDNFKIFGGFRYVFNDMGSGTSHYLDNVSVYNHIARGRITVGNFQGVPNNIKAGVAFLYPRKENPIGFIFDGKNINLKATVANGLKLDKKIKISVSLVSQDGETEDAYSGITELNSFENQSLNINLKAKYFGFHCIKTTVSDETGELLHYDEFQISTVNFPKEIVGNERVGINGYALTGGNDFYGIMDIERKTKLYERAGVGASRFDITLEQHDRSDLVNGEHLIFDEYMSRDTREKLVILGKTHKYLPVSEDDYESWREYVIDICQRFGDEIDYYQVWNEFNSPVFNKGNNTTEEYVELLKFTYRIVKEYDPTAKVVCNPGANCNASDGYEQDTIDFMKDIFWTYEGYKYMDVMSIHAYVYNDPEVTIADNGSSPRERFVYELKEWLESIGYGDFPVIITEIGYSPSTADGEYSHAKNFVRYSTLHREDIECIYWYRDINLGFTEDTLGEGYEFQRNLGFVREDNYIASYPYPEYAAKPAFLALCNYNALTTDAVFESSSLENGIYDYKYKAADGDMLNIVWKRKGTGTKTYNTNGKICEVYDLYGNIVNVSEASSDTFTVDVSTSPVYVKFVTPEEYEMYIDASEQRLWVKGNIEKDTEVFFALYKTTDGNTETVDMTQGRTNENGSYSTMIPIGEISDTSAYSLSVGYSNDKETVYSALNKDIPYIYLMSDGKRITKLSQLKNGDILNGMFEYNGSDANYDVTLIIAGYDSEGRVIDAGISTYPISSEDKTINMTVKNIETVKEIRLYAWKADSQMPVTMSYVIK